MDYKVDVSKGTNMDYTVEAPQGTDTDQSKGHPSRACWEDIHFMEQRLNSEHPIGYTEVRDNPAQNLSPPSNQYTTRCNTATREGERL